MEGSHYNQPPEGSSQLAPVQTPQTQIDKYLQFQYIMEELEMENRILIIISPDKAGKYWIYTQMDSWIYRYQKKRQTEKKFFFVGWGRIFNFSD